MKLECPKCGTGQMVGPSYCPGRYCDLGHWEHLHYRCERCGFRDAEPTKDVLTPAPLGDKK